MEITNIKIKLAVNDNRRVKGYANILLDDCFAVNNIKIVEGKDRMFIAMPNRRLEDGAFVDVAHPINTDFRNKLTEKVMNKFSEELRNLLRDKLELPGEYYIGLNDNDIMMVNLFKSNEEMPNEQGELLKEYCLENYLDETLEELKEEMLSDIGA